MIIGRKFQFCEGCKGYSIENWNFCPLKKKQVCKIRSCLQKLDTGFWNYGSVCFLAPIGSKLVLKKILFFCNMKNISCKTKPDKILHKISLHFLELDDFWQSYEGYLQRTTNKPIKNSALGCHSKYEVPLSLSSIKTPFWNTKM